MSPHPTFPPPASPIQGVHKAKGGSRVSACFLGDPCACWAAVRGKQTHLAGSPGQNCCLTYKDPLQADVFLQGDLTTLGSSLAAIWLRSSLPGSTT